ncbi:MAG: hypothetical protein AAFV62_01985 [Pseudomonadota bacterium]
MAQQSFLTAFATRYRVTMATVIQSFKRHRAGARLGLIMALLEFAAGILIMGLLFSLIGRTAPVGGGMLLFLLTGLLPFACFQQTTGKVAMAMQMGSMATRIPLTTPLGRGVAAMVEMLIIASIVGTAMLVGMTAAGEEFTPPRYPLMCAQAVILGCVFGFGIGVLNFVIDQFVRGWLSIWQMFSRGLFFLSGIFFVVDLLPPQARDILAWNPLVHLLTTFRLGVYPQYPDIIYDPVYLVGWVFAALFIALWAERLLRRKMT